MKSFKLNFLLLTLCCLTLSFSIPPIKGTIIIEFSEINPNQGVAEASIYTKSETFLVKDQYVEKKRSQIVDGKAQIVFENIPLGKVAIGSYHDIDADEIYDKNFIGLPEEPYAFSRKPTCTWRKPRFEDVSIDFTKNGQIVKMKFQRFLE